MKLTAMEARDSLERGTEILSIRMGVNGQLVLKAGHRCYASSLKFHPAPSNKRNGGYLKDPSKSGISEVLCCAKQAQHCNSTTLMLPVHLSYPQAARHSHQKSWRVPVQARESTHFVSYIFSLSFSVSLFNNVSSFRCQHFLSVFFLLLGVSILSVSSASLAA